MSEKSSRSADPRARKSHDALVAAFNELVLARRYDEIRVDDILGDAEVSRSTFYEHFPGKDDLLLHSMSKLFDLMATAVDERASEDALRGVLEHFAQNREIARYLFAGPPAKDVVPRMSRELAARIEHRVEARVAERGSRPQLASSAIAAHVADATFALVGRWLARQVECDAATLAGALRASTQASIAALIAR